MRYQSILAVASLNHESIYRYDNFLFRGKDCGSLIGIDPVSEGKERSYYVGRANLRDIVLWFKMIKSGKEFDRTVKSGAFKVGEHWDTPIAVHDNIKLDLTNPGYTEIRFSKRLLTLVIPRLI